MGWESFVKNRLPLLNLSVDVLEVLRYGKVEYTFQDLRKWHKQWCGSRTKRLKTTQKTSQHPDVLVAQLDN